jgi:hypothetical protein
MLLSLISFITYFLDFQKKETDLRLWAAIGNPNEAFMVLDAAQHMVRPASRCKDIAVTNSSSMPCQCRLNFCVPW